MSVEQTSQLIQLILNSVVIVTACVIISSGLTMRHLAIVNQLRLTQQAYFELLREDTHRNVYGGQRESERESRLMQLKTQLRQLRRHYRTAHYSILSAHYALLFCGGSTLAIAFRTLIGSNWLINLSLVLFTVGVGILLISVGTTLWGFHIAHRSLWHEVSGVLNSGARGAAAKTSVSRSTGSRTEVGSKRRRGAYKSSTKVG